MMTRTRNVEDSMFINLQTYALRSFQEYENLIQYTCTCMHMIAGGRQVLISLYLNSSYFISTDYEKGFGKSLIKYENVT